MRQAFAFVLTLMVLPLAAQESALFPSLSVTAATSPTSFDTSVRIDPGTLDEEGTRIGFEQDLGLDDSDTVEHFSLRWRPFQRHELSVSWLSAPRTGFATIRREIVFRDEIYPINADVTTAFDFESLDL